MVEVRYRIGDAGTFLALRQTARLVAEHPEEATSADDVIILDFTGVQAVTGAFADELLARVTDTSPGYRLRIEGATADVRDTLAITLERRGLDATWGQTGDGND